MNNSQFPQLAERRLGDHGERLRGNLSENATLITSVSMVIGCLVVLGTVLRMHLLTNQSFWFDEGATLAMTDSVSFRQTYDSLMAIYGGDKYQPLYFYLISVWREIFGSSEFGLRLSSVIPGVLTPVLIYLAAKPLFGNRHALLSALFLVCSAFCVSYSQELRPYGFLLFLASLQFLVLSPALAAPEQVPNNRIALAIVTMIACFGSILLILFTVVMAAAHLLAFRQWQVWFKTWFPAAIASVPVLFYFLGTPAITDVSVDAINGTGMPIWKNLVFSQYGHIAGLSFGPSLESLRNMDTLWTVLTIYAPQLLLLALSCAVLLIFAILNIRRGTPNEHSKKLAHFLIIFYVLALLGATLIAVVTEIHWMPRHSVYLMLPICLLLPLGLNTTLYTLPKQWLQLQSGATTAAFATLLLINLYASGNYFFNPDHWRDDYRAAALYLEQIVGEEDESLMLWGEPYLIDYYGHSEIKSLWRLEDEELIMSKISQATNKKGQIYISINREYSWAKHSTALISLLDSSFELIPSAQFTNFNIYRLNGKQLTKNDAAGISVN